MCPGAVTQNTTVCTYWCEPQENKPSRFASCCKQVCGSSTLQLLPICASPMFLWSQNIAFLKLRLRIGTADCVSREFWVLSRKGKARLESVSRSKIFTKGKVSSKDPPNPPTLLELFLVLVTLFKIIHIFGNKTLLHLTLGDPPT